ncbi:GID complex subunit containing RING finger motif [Rhizina undulata]
MSLSTTKLNPENHLLLDQPLLRVPHESLRKTFKTSQKHFEREHSFILSTVRDAATTAVNKKTNDIETTGEESLQALDTMISRMKGYKRKVEALREDEKCHHEHSRKRIAHLQDLYNIPSLVDEAYEKWSRTRLDRLLADFLLRSGMGKSAGQLAKEKDIEDLVDVDVFVQCSKIEQSLNRGSTTECLAWCAENKNTLRKIKSPLEFELRLQQFIELVRSRQLREAAIYSKKHLAPHADNHLEHIQKAAGLLAFPPDTACGRYKEMYSSDRWAFLASSFISTHHNLYGLPSRPLLHIALSAGLSSLKTPSCHSSVQPSSSSTTASVTTSLCPICSKELKELARNVPYAHHVRSTVEPDPVVLPNGRIYGRERLEELAAKIGLGGGKVRDPTTGEEWGWDKVRKVFIM